MMFAFRTPSAEKKLCLAISKLNQTDSTSKNYSPLVRATGKFSRWIIRLDSGTQSKIIMYKASI